MLADIAREHTISTIGYNGTGFIPFLASLSPLYTAYIRGEAYLAAGQGASAAAEFQKILDHSGLVWNCWTANVARVRALTAYKDFLTLWKHADPDIRSTGRRKANTAGCNKRLTCWRTN